jgi:PIN domain
MSVPPLVYLETSFISHLTARSSRDALNAAKQHSSRQWWESCRDHFRLVVSPTVYEECRAGEPEMAQKRLHLLEENAFLLPQTPAIPELARRFLEPAGPLPSKAEADALHIASASSYGCEFLLTWNFKHIANAIIKRRLERILHEHGYEPPTICTPDELLGELA